MSYKLSATCRSLARSELWESGRDIRVAEIFMTKLVERCRDCVPWLFAHGEGAMQASGKAYSREWRRRQVESLREAHLRQHAKQQTTK
jgi:hypothetical protein